MGWDVNSVGFPMTLTTPNAPCPISLPSSPLPTIPRSPAHLSRVCPKDHTCGTFLTVTRTLPRRTLVSGIADMSGEQSISQVKAMVMSYDDNGKKWMPSGGTPGFSNVHLYENVNGSYRVVGHHSQTRQVVINCSIPKGLVYHEATPMFHQWRFNQHIYGLNFVSEEDAAVFSAAIKGALCTLDTGSTPTPSFIPPVQAASSQNPPNTRRANGTETAEQGTGQSPIPQPPPLPPQATPAHYAVPKPQSVSQAPPAPPPLPNSSGIPTPPAPPPLPSSVGGGGSAPPPPPPLPTSLMRGGGGDASGGLASALASAKLKKVTKPDEGSGSGGSSSSVGSTTAGGGGGNLMQEMSEMLKRRRKTVAKSLPQDNAEVPDEGESNIRQNADGAGRRRDSPAGMITRAKPAEMGVGNGESRRVGGRDELTQNCDYNRLKQDIMDDVRRELQTMKEEIIAAIRSELGKINT
uniref:vasodilator-stimulated phosphoprotein-like n=1 Tax=Myxine glutinosa TaxID=7769 RepID=UPI00358F946C